MKVTVAEYNDYDGNTVEAVLTDSEIIKRLKKTSSYVLRDFELNDISILSEFGCKNKCCDKVFVGGINTIKEHEEDCKHGN